MSSVLKAYERFTLTQELQDQSEEGTIPPTTLKPVIRVFILTSNNPELRSRLLLFCLRIVLSNGARDSHRFGALLTMFSLPSATMLNHVKLADQSPEADIERVEIDGFEEGSFRLIPNARSGMSRGEINAYAALAEDLPDTLNHATPFVDSEVEGTAWDEIETFLDMCYSVLMQAWIVTCKCMTAPDQPAASIEKRLQKYRQQGRINPKYLLQPEARRIIQNVIRKGMVVRHFLTFELQLARAQSLVSNRYYAMVGDVGKYIENCGMGGFFLTLKYALGTRWPTLALAAFSGELTKLKSLMALYQTLGEKARYLALLESPHLMDFAAANYPLLYSYAMGIGYVLDVNMRNYAFSRSYMNKPFTRFSTLITFLWCYFERITVLRSTYSDPANHEVYLICILANNFAFQTVSQATGIAMTLTDQGFTLISPERINQYWDGHLKQERIVVEAIDKVVLGENALLNSSDNELILKCGGTPNARNLIDIEPVATFIEFEQLICTMLTTHLKEIIDITRSGTQDYESLLLTPYNLGLLGKISTIVRLLTERILNHTIRNWLIFPPSLRMIVKQDLEFGIFRITSIINSDRFLKLSPNRKYLIAQLTAGYIKKLIEGDCNIDLTRPIQKQIWKALGCVVYCHDPMDQRESTEFIDININEEIDRGIDGEEI